MARILFIADGGAHTGFARVAQSIGDRLVDMGHDIHVLAANYRGDHWPTKMKLYPASMLEPNDKIGFGRVLEMMSKVMPDVVFVLNDPAIIMHLMFDNKYDPEHVLWSGAQIGETVYKPPVIAYIPIDGYESPRSWDILSERVTRVAMSHFGQQTMPEAPVVWHGVDTSIYGPADRAEAKRLIGYDPDRFLILRVDKNSTRKDFAATWKALRPLLRKYPDIDVHFHCQIRTPDFDLNAVRFNDEDIRDRVNFSPNIGGFTGWPEELIATLYAAADLFVSTSWGEGFGLTLLESMACGTPVVAQNCSAITEVVGPGGVLIEPAGRITVPMGQEQCLPDIDAFTREIEHLYLAGGVRRKLAKAGIEHAKQFSWDVAAQKINDIVKRVVEAPVVSIPG